MSRATKAKDKRTRLDLDLFILAMVDRGVNTPYALMTVGALSQGATNPALARLEADGYVTKGGRLARGRNDYVVTRSGRAHLDRSWRSLVVASPVGEIETILRIASLARLMGLPNSRVKAYLRAAALAKKSMADNLATKTAASKPVSVALYSTMKQVADSKRLLSEAVALRAIAASLRK